MCFIKLLSLCIISLLSNRVQFSEIRDEMEIFDRAWKSSEARTPRAGVGTTRSSWSRLKDIYVMLILETIISITKFVVLINPFESSRV